MRSCTSLILTAFFIFTGLNAQNDKGSANNQMIFITGGELNKTFINYVAGLTGKDKPKICFLPTASGDSPYSIIYWYELCHDLNVEPFVQRVWISSYSQKETFEESLLKMDAIISGGGNTLNMLAIWKAQGIDTVLLKALRKGIILGGGSAGSLCWFVDGTTDSRPNELSIIEGLGFLKYSHCPHYSSEKYRRPLYLENIKKGILLPGYACDNKSGILFINGEASEVVSMDSLNNSYFVYKKGDEVIEEKLRPRIIK